MATKKSSFQALPSEKGIQKMFRHDGHSFEEYMGELLDNSLDANATNCNISIKETQIKPNSRKMKVKEILIADNGKGMSLKKIQEILCTGISNLDTTKAMGNFGVGLKSALYSLGDSFELLSKTKNGQLIKVSADFNNSKRKNFEILVLNPSKDDADCFKTFSGNMGTLIKITNTNPNVVKYKSESFIEYLSKTYNKKLDNINIIVNEKKISPICPLGSVDKKLKESSSLFKGVNVKIISNKKEAQAKHRGIYFYINDRLVNIKSNQSYGLNNPLFNFLRVEVSVDSWDVINRSNGNLHISPQKNSVKFSGDMEEKFKKFLESVKSRFYSNTAGGGANTNANGKVYERKVNLTGRNTNDLKFTEEKEIVNRGKVVGHYGSQGEFKSILKEKFNIDLLDIISSELKPDEFVFQENSKELIVLENKYQTVEGSVDEKLQTCHFKKYQYEKVAKQLGYTSVKLIYLLNDWFSKEKYTDVLNYMKAIGCDYIITEKELSGSEKKEILGL